MFDLDTLVRPNIRALRPYSSARDEFTGKTGTFLDANESPYGTLNRYPDPHQKTLKKTLSGIKNIPTEQIFIGNGSDEIIDLAFRIFCRPGVDKALTFSPTYGMYRVAANINNIELIEDELTADFQIDLVQFERRIQDENIKIIFLCSPNNPTGNTLKNLDIILQKFKGVVIVDEAYIDFSGSKSMIYDLKKYPNLIVSQTLSKAWGLAAARVGIAYANVDIMAYFRKVKPPYNVSLINQEAAIAALENYDFYRQNLREILEQKQWLFDELSRLKIVKKIYPSDANFWLVETPDANKIYAELTQRKIIIRNRNKLIKNCLRITVGTPEENQKLIENLSDLKL